MEIANEFLLEFHEEIAEVFEFSQTLLVYVQHFFYNFLKKSMENYQQFP